jgi:tight adherence protein C
MLDLVTLVVFALVASLVWLSVSVLGRPRPAPAGVPLPGIAPTAADRRGGPLVESLAAQLPEVSLVGEVLDKDLRRAGYYRPAARQRFLALRNGLTILAVIVTGLVAVAIGPDHPAAVVRTLAVGLVVAGMCWALPRLVLAVQAKRRVRRIQAGLPDALDTISMCLGGGISLQECLAYVGGEMTPVHPDLALELLIVNQQADISSFEFGIQQFAARLDAPEIVALAALVTQSQRLGTGLVEAVREFADDLRLKRRQTAEAKAGRAELFLLFPIVLCLVPSVILVLWGPSLLEIWRFLRDLEAPITTGL